MIAEHQDDRRTRLTAAQRYRPSREGGRHQLLRTTNCSTRRLEVGLHKSVFINSRHHQDPRPRSTRRRQPSQQPNKHNTPRADTTNGIQGNLRTTPTTTTHTIPRHPSKREVTHTTTSTEGASPLHSKWHELAQEHHITFVLHDREGPRPIQRFK